MNIITVKTMTKSEFHSIPFKINNFNRMRCIFLGIFIFCSLIIYAQQDTTQKVIRVSGGLMSDLNKEISLNDNNIAQFSFNWSEKDMNLEISLWETSFDSDTLSKVILFNENLIKNETRQISLQIDQNNSQIDIKCIVPGKMIIVAPLKSQMKQTQAYRFLSKPQIRDINVPIMLFVDKDKTIVEKNMTEILTVQKIESIDKQQIKKLKKDFGNYKILTYHLKYIQ